MGGYSNQAQQMLNVKQSAPLVDKFYESSTYVTKGTISKSQQLIDFVGHTFGYGWVCSGFIVGILVILSFLFKKKIKEKLGDTIKSLDNWINK